jgi:uncharacterized protein with PIN domain
MVLDTSALLAILLEETEAEELSHAIAADPKRLVGAFSLPREPRRALSWRAIRGSKKSVLGQRSASKGLGFFLKSR